MNVHVDCTLKRGYSPASVYSKFEKIIKPTGIMKKWKLMQTDSTVTVDFADDTMFTLLFDGQHFDGDCPTVHDSEEPIDKKSADYKKMKLIYALKSICKEYCITDDGTAWFRYLESMRYKAYFRQLTDEETALVRRYCEMGVDAPERLVTTHIYHTLRLNSLDEFKALSKSKDSVFAEYFPFAGTVEQWAKRTCLFRGEPVKMPAINHTSGFEPICLAIHAQSACINEMHTLCVNPDHRFDTRNVFGAAHGILRRMLYDDFVPAIKQAEDNLSKCLLAYRVFVSALDYNGLEYVGLEGVPHA